MLEFLCRRYNSLFKNSHPEEANLVSLHSSGQIDRFHQAYFDHELQKGQKVVEYFAKIASGWQGGRILDFGCGGGGLTFEIAKVAREAIGIDLEPEKLDFARAQMTRFKTSNLDFVSYDGSTLPFPDQSFNCIFCIDVIEHLPTPELFVKEFFRVLAPGGYLLLSFGPPWCHPHGKHMWAKLPGWWTHLLFPRATVMRVAGFAPQTTWEQLGLHRLTVRKFHKVMRQSPFINRFLEERINPKVRAFKSFPWIRELFISEIVGVYQKPLGVNVNP
jgi:ubiquinone/menaquinone biosynthesis C-methylase UbiE